MLKTMVERAGFAELFVQVQKDDNSEAKLAAVPAAASHFGFDVLYERPVQAQLVKLLLLPKQNKQFMSCVLIHGMGGTGKTVG